jgi:curved DNA-binding protein
MDHYSTLGVNKNATSDDIKKAYRKLASQHHPDKGGDTATFQEIQTAYDILSNPDKRAQYDNPQPQFTGGPFGGNSADMEDILRNMFGGNPFFGAGFQQRQQRNRNLNMQTTISLEEAFYGKDLIATIGLPSGREQMVEVKIPAGVQDGTTLRLSQMGDDSISGIPRGDMHLTINVSPHNKFLRQGDDLVSNIEISCFDAILGKTLYVDTIDSKTLELVIRPGTQHGQILAAAGYGMPKMNDNRFKGRLLINVSIKMPNNLTDAQKQILKEHFQ